MTVNGVIIRTSDPSSFARAGLEISLFGVTIFLWRVGGSYKLSCNVAPEVRSQIPSVSIRKKISSGTQDNFRAIRAKRIHLQ